jgi:hypothetical protein
MQIFVVDVNKTFDSMEFAKPDKQKLEDMKASVDKMLKDFDIRVEGYRRTAESPLVVDESVRQDAIAQYQADAEKMKASVAASRIEIDSYAKSINEGMRRAFDAAVKAAVEHISECVDLMEHIVIPAESALSVSAEAWPNGSDITGLVISFTDFSNYRHDQIARLQEDSNG